MKFMVFNLHQKIEINDVIYEIGELWDGNGNAQQLLADECMAIDEDYVVEFTILEYNNDDILDTIIEVTDIY